MLEKITYDNCTIHFGDLQTVGFNDLLKTDYSEAKKIIFTDETVSALWIEQLVTNHSELSKAEIIQIPAGEEYKTLEVCEQVWAALSDYEITRSDLIINFGGGVISDMGGLIASLFKRGLNFINIPTTLLSQVDASVGGKTAVDLGPYKNQIGLFANAQHVFIDDTFLATLPDEELISGFAEMLKHGLIADADYWDKLKSMDLKSEIGRLEVIQYSVQIKKNIVEKDPKEGGLRKNLNFGHTVGHGIEGLLLKSGTPTLHGYAVAWGMLAESFISFKKELISKNEFEDIQSTLKSKYPDFPIPQDQFKDILKLMYNDKKNKAGQIKMSLLDSVGKGIFDQEVSDVEILESLKFLFLN